MEEISLITSGGIGDQILAFQVANLLKNFQGKDIKIYSSSRDEVFKPLNFLFGKKFVIEQIEETQVEELVNSDIEFQEFTNKINKSYLVWPDLLFNHKRSFPYEKYNLNLQTIRDTKVLLGDKISCLDKKIIYCALNTSTDFYFYPQKWGLIKQLALKNSDYIVHFNLLTKWNGKELNNYIPDNLPVNCKITKDCDFINEINIIRESKYVICLDNGPSHIAYNFGIPRLLLDNRMNMESLMFIPRWREDLRESIGYHYDTDKIAELVKINLEIPQTQLLTRSVVINNLGINWKRQLNFKY